DGTELGDAGVHEENVDLAELFDDRSVKAVNVGGLGDVGLHGQGAVADEVHRFVESFLTAAGNRDFCAFVVQTFSRSETNAAVAAGDDCDLAFKAFHEMPPGLSALSQRARWRRATSDT